MAPDDDVTPEDETPDMPDDAVSADDADVDDADADPAADDDVDIDEADGDPDVDTEAAAVTTNTTRNRVLAGIGVVAVLALLGWLLFGRGEEPPPPTTTTTTTTPTTTTEPAGRPALISQVATAKPEVSTLTVWSAPPPEWETATPVTVWEAPELPASQAEFDDRPALPRDDYPIDGRYATPTGWEFSNPTAFDDPLTLLVTETRGNWAKVMLPVRPNGTQGFIDLSQVGLSEHDYRVELDVSDRVLTAYKGTEVIAQTPVVVGKDATRTPTGRFFLTDVVDDPPSTFYGPYVLPLNGYSEQLDIFDDGVPVIAIHGTSRPDLLGQAASNGCVRIPNEIITQLEEQLPLGTQVEIYA